LFVRLVAIVTLSADEEEYLVGIDPPPHAAVNFRYLFPWTALSTSPRGIFARFSRLGIEFDSHSVFFLVVSKTKDKNAFSPFITIGVLGFGACTATFDRREFPKRIYVSTDSTSPTSQPFLRLEFPLVLQGLLFLGVPAATLLLALTPPRPDDR